MISLILNESMQFFFIFSIVFIEYFLYLVSKIISSMISATLIYPRDSRTIMYLDK